MVKRYKVQTVLTCSCINKFPAWRCFLIVDESIKMKNFEAKRTQRMLTLGAMVEYKLILNGTPITKNVMDIWSQIHFLSL
jgi:hypothetical protein